MDEDRVAGRRDLDELDELGGRIDEPKKSLGPEPPPLRQRRKGQPGDRLKFRAAVFATLAFWRGIGMLERVTILIDLPPDEIFVARHDGELRAWPDWATFEEETGRDPFRINQSECWFSVPFRGPSRAIRLEFTKHRRAEHPTRIETEPLNEGERLMSDETYEVSSEVQDCLSFRKMITPLVIQSSFGSERPCSSSWDFARPSDRPR